MKPFLAFFVIFLTAFTLGGILPDSHELARLEQARKQAIDESSASVRGTFTAYGATYITKDGDLDDIQSRNGKKWNGKK